MNFMGSSVFGNTIGVISLFIGIVSLIITIFTFKKAKLVEEEIKEYKGRSKNKIMFRQLSSQSPRRVKEQKGCFKHPAKTIFCNDAKSTPNFSYFAQLFKTVGATKRSYHKRSS